VSLAGAEAILSVQNFSALVRRDEKNIVLYPQFGTNVNGVKQYSPVFNDDAQFFCGWLPYQLKRWDLASDKLLFKDFAIKHGLKVPAYSLTPNPQIDSFIIKRRASSFGAQIKGPFAGNHAVTVSEDNGEYIEQFISGKILKIWYWNDMPTCMEVDQMPYIMGDGVSSIRTLLERRLRSQKKINVSSTDLNAVTYDFQNVESVLAFYGVSLDTILDYGVEQRVEFRYATDFMLPNYRRTIDLEQNMPVDLRETLINVGAVLWSGIPNGIKKDCVYTVDAILDKDRSIWLLEMNSNPFVHPYIYRQVISSLFPGSGTSTVSQLH